MTKKISGKKTGSVKSASIDAMKEARSIGGTEQVKGVTNVKATTSVGGVKGSGGIGKRRPTRIMSVAEREQLFQMIHEEADKLVSAGAIPKNKKEVITNAVKMTVDASLSEDEEASGKPKS